MRIAAVTRMRLRGVEVTALVGKSGTGKSFRARLIAEKRGAEVIIDDGLVIYADTICAGHWAKKERFFMARVRRALFAETEHSREARAALGSIRFRRVLITATSGRMADRIAANLWLPAPSHIIGIEDVATRQEIADAMRRRGRQREHSPPVPDVRIRRTPLSSVLALLRRGRTAETVPLRIADAPGTGRGLVAFSEAAVSQMALHCVKEFDRRIADLRMVLTENAGMVVLELTVRIPPSMGGAGRLHALRDAVLHGMERGTGIIFRDIRLVVEEIGSSAEAEKAPPADQ